MAEVRAVAHKVALAVEVVAIVITVHARAAAVIRVALVACWLHDGVEAVTGAIWICQVTIAGVRAERRERRVRRTGRQQPFGRVAAKCVRLSAEERTSYYLRVPCHTVA